MPVTVQELQSSHAFLWDKYVFSHSGGSLYHLSGWRDVIKKAYGHRSYYLMALEHYDKVPRNEAFWTEARVVGVLPLVHLKHPLFGNSLVSMPFFDLGGILSDDRESETSLLYKSLVLAGRLKADTIELRNQGPGVFFQDCETIYPSTLGHEPPLEKVTFETRSNKVRMVLRLPESSKVLMDSFKAKLRSQIKKPLKEGLTSRIGAKELLDDFYKVFSINMRDLGSPVHSRSLIAQVLEVFSETARIIVIYKNGFPLAGSLVVGFRDTLENPWASALREYSRLSPNMLLYWSMLEYACEHGFRYFDFGRSSQDEGTYRFKEQWGAKPIPLHWQYFSGSGKCSASRKLEKSKFEKAIQCWQKLPVPLTRVLGPIIRRHIGL